MTKEEALKVVKDFGICFPNEVSDALEVLIPELADSEEDRIRKDIIALIKFALEDGSAVSPGSHTTKEEALAYLEKQKEQKSSDEYTIIGWPEIQAFMDLEGFDDNAALIDENDSMGIGSSTYLVSVDWLNSL